nr:MAG TPA: radical SAM peptide maturase, FibroRumin system [Caudoviricetes sp.]
MENRYGLSLLVSENCNMKCSFCYQHKEKAKKNMAIETAEKAIEKIKQEPGFNGEIEFFGGEPSLNLELIEHIMNKYPEYRYCIISNGLWVDNPKACELMKRMWHVTISIEGTDYAYQTIKKQPSVRKMIEKVNKIEGLYVSFNISINGLLLRDFDEYVENLKFIAESGHNWHIYALRSMEDYFKDNNEWFEFIMLCKEHLPQVYEHYISVYDEGNAEYFSKDIDKEHSPYMCGLDEDITVRYDGTISPCIRYADIKHNMDEIENLGDHLLASTVVLSNIKNFPRCENCIVKNVGVCWMNCPAFHDECERTPGGIERLNQLCERERIRQLLRDEFWAEHPEYENKKCIYNPDGSRELIDKEVYIDEISIHDKTE